MPGLFPKYIKIYIFSIFYDVRECCDYIISWNTVSAFCSIYATQFFVNFVIYLMHVDHTDSSENLSKSIKI